ncbi:MAG: hypothetical protein ACXW4C_02350 [Nitrospira sp.]
MSALTALSSIEENFTACSAKLADPDTRMAVLEGQGLSNGGEHSRRSLRALTQNTPIATAHSGEAWVQDARQVDL